MKDTADTGCRRIQKNDRHWQKGVFFIY